MLVFSKIPNGVLHLDCGQLGKYIVYGSESGRDPVDVSWEVYNTCRDALQDATYREGVLSQIFGKPFPAIAFTYNELKFLPDNTINTIGPLMVEEFDVDWSHKKKIDEIKLSLRGKDARYKDAAISRWQ